MDERWGVKKNVEKNCEAQHPAYSINIWCEGWFYFFVCILFSGKICTWEKSKDSLLSSFDFSKGSTCNISSRRESFYNSSLPHMFWKGAKVSKKIHTTLSQLARSSSRKWEKHEKFLSMLQTHKWGCFDINSKSRAGRRCMRMFEGDEDEMHE